MKSYRENGSEKEMTDFIDCYGYIYSRSRIGIAERGSAALNFYLNN
jgi:hypothetical protein